MNREQLILTLQQVQTDGAAAARASLVDGARFEVWGDLRPLPASHFWAIWDARWQWIQEEGTWDGKDFATALPALKRAGEQMVYLGVIRGADRTHLVFLSEDLEHCVACF